MDETSMTAAASVALRKAMQWRSAALQAMDFEQLQELLDETLRYTHSNGICEDKPTYLAALRGGDYIYYSVEETDLDAFDLAGHVWCAGSVRMHALVKGVERRMHNRFLAVWRNTPNGLRLAAYCATPIAAGQ